MTSRQQISGSVVAARTGRTILDFFQSETAPNIYVFPGQAGMLVNLRRWLPRAHFVGFGGILLDGPSPGSIVHDPQRAPSPRDGESAGEFAVRHTKWILRHEDTCAYVQKHGPGLAVLALPDDESVELVERLGLTLANADPAIARHVDSKVETTRIAKGAGVPVVPYVTGVFPSYAAARSAAESESFFDDLVLQVPYGESGEGTYFIKDEGDWEVVAAEGADAIESKLMPRLDIDEYSLAVVITASGLAVGEPVLNLVGHSALVVNGRSYCGSEAGPQVMQTPELSDTIREYGRRMGRALADIGFRGTFGLDFLVDQHGSVYLGEVNPRFTGATPVVTMTTAVSHSVPIPLFHFLEFIDAADDIAADVLRRVKSNDQPWSQLTLRNTGGAGIVSASPQRGMWQLESGGGATLLAERSRDLPEPGPGQAWYQPAGDFTGGPVLLDSYLGSFMFPGASVDGLGRLTPLARQWTDHFRSELTVIR